MRVLAVLFLSSLLASAVTPAVAPAAEPFPPGNELGVSIGTPAGLNLELMHEFGKHAFFLSGMYYGRDDRGGQVGVTLERGGRQRKYFSLNLVGGYFFFRDSDDDETWWGYGGLEPYFRYRAFFVAPAVTFGSGSVDVGSFNESQYHGPLITARLGFSWRL